MTTIRWGILSTANIARRRVVPAIHKAANSVAHAIASRNQHAAEAFRAELGLAHAYDSYEALLDAPDVDAIYIGLPNSLHAEWAIPCAEAGKPTLCEKPLAANADEAQRMVDAFKARGVPFAEAFMWRFHPQTLRVQQLIREGAVGRIQSIQAAFTFSIREESNIRLNASLAGGALMDVGCYCINAMRLYTGEEPTDSAAYANIGAQSGVDETLAGVLRFPSGVLGHFDCGLRSQHCHMVEIRGDKGRILIEESFVMPPDRATKIRVWRNIAPAADAYEEITIPPFNSYTLMIEDFADALVNQRPPRFDAQDGVHNMRVIDHLLASLK